MNLSMAMCKVALLRLNNLEDSSREGNQSTGAIGIELVFSI